MEVAVVEEEDATATATEEKHIPAVLIEEILLYLPFKSLFRFCAVSKSWNSTILRPDFRKRYRRRGREMAVVSTYDPIDDEPKHLVCPLSSISSSDKPLDGASPFKAAAAAAPDASCGELWCVEFENSLILGNPSIQQYRKLPIPSGRVPIGSTVGADSTSVFVYGLGYDPVSDDYKILKMHRNVTYVETELYSLKTDSWRKVNSPPQRQYKFQFLTSKGVFALGALHWVIRSTYYPNFPVRAVMSFDLTTHNYRVWNMPSRLTPICGDEGPCRSSGIFAFGGKLRAWQNYGRRYSRFAVWVVSDDYMSRPRQWIKELEVDYAPFYPLCYSYLKPFYLYDSAGKMVEAVISSTDTRKIFLCKKQEEDGDGDGDGASICSLVGKDFGGNGCGMFETYVESFVSPYPE